MTKRKNACNAECRGSLQHLSERAASFVLTYFSTDSSNTIFDKKKPFNQWAAKYFHHATQAVTIKYD